MQIKYLFFTLIISASLFSGISFSAEINIGAKKFTEGNILAHILKGYIRKISLKNSKQALSVNVMENLGGTGVLAAAIESNEIQIYIDYTGTLEQVYQTSSKSLESTLLKRRIILGQELGFNNSYGVAVQSDSSLESISDLNFAEKKDHLEFGVSHEFKGRTDGLKPFLSHYSLQNLKIITMEHSLLYEAMKSKELNLMEVYTTDAKLKKYNLRVLKDDKAFFPKYSAVVLASKKFVEKYPEIWEKLNSLIRENPISEKNMIALNYAVEVERFSYEQAADSFLKNNSLEKVEKIFEWRNIFKHLIEHILYVFFTVLICTLLGIPIGIFCAKSKRLGGTVMGIISAMQTIPSLALLVFFIPLFGLGNITVLVALVIYGLLPIVKNTVTALSDLPRDLIEFGEVMAMTSFQKLYLIELPLGKEIIYAGIKICAIYAVGITVIAAFVGGGGLGVLIVTGLSLNNHEMILQGAIPSALLAIFIEWGYKKLNSKGRGGN